MTRKARDLLGATQFQPLLVLADAGTPLTTVELGVRMAAITGRAPYQPGALTTMMTRLEDDGLVTSEFASWEKPGRVPKLYQLTPAGLARLGDTVGQFRRLMMVADRVQGLASAA